MNVHYPILLLVCVFVTCANGYIWWWWRRWSIGSRCNTPLTVSVVSSECSTPLEGVRISTPGRYSRVDSSSNGVYDVRVCRLPVTLRLRKRGFRTARRWARHSEETVTMPCLGSSCTAMTVSTSVTSSCGKPLEDVTCTSPNIMGVSSPSAGMYDLMVCSLPAEVTCEKEGFEPVASTLTEPSAALQLSCSGPHCGSGEITLTVQSSDCSTPVDGVTITSDDAMAITATGQGTYTCDVCTMPITVSLQKPGFSPLTTTVTGSSQIITLTCSDPLCTAETVSTTVSSQCDVLLEDVTITSPGLLSVDTHSTGVFLLSMCALPQEITVEKTGFETVTQVITGTTAAVQMTCNAGSCGHVQQTITVRSSDCDTLVSDVTITSDDFIVVTSTSVGQYEIEVCSLPVLVTLEKPGFMTTVVNVDTDTTEVTLPCEGTSCTGQTASVSVTSDCTPNVVGVTVSGQDVLDVSSSAPGSYQIAVCLQPTLVTFDRLGYASLQTSISDGSTVTLTCISSPFMIQDPSPKYRAEGEDAKLCCEAEVTTGGIMYKWFKDGSELGETTNELLLTSLTAADEGRYKCSAKSLADESLPAVMSYEASLTIRANSDSCADAREDNMVEILPGCIKDVGKCSKRPCRSNPASPETCSDDNICCELTDIQDIDCGGGVIIPYLVVTGCSCSCQAPFITVSGIVENSMTDDPLAEIVVSVVGDVSTATTTDLNGQFSFTVPSTRKRLVIKAEDSAGTYLDAYVVESILSETFTLITVNIAMIEKAPFIEINSEEESSLSISSDPSQPNSGPAFLTIPANAFFNSDGTQYNGSVYVSLTYLDPLNPETLEIIPGEFTTLNANGELDILVTMGVFAFLFEDGLGSPLILNDKIDVYGASGYSVWELDEPTGTWTLINSLPDRRKRQASQNLIGSFNPLSGIWYNIDFVSDEPDCFFKVRVFQDGFSAENEIKSGLKMLPTVRQILNSGNEGIKYYFYKQPDTGCYRIKCPAAVARAKISLTAFETAFGLPGINIPLLPATIEEYSENPGIQSILQSPSYSYSISMNDTTKVLINTPSALTGPFYLSMDSCATSPIENSAFWFEKQTEFMESEFYDDYEGRCVGKIRINLQSELPIGIDDITSSAIRAVSIWSETNYGLRMAPIHEETDEDGFTSYASCFEYRCRTQDDVASGQTSVLLGLSNDTDIPLRCDLDRDRGFPVATKRKRFTAGIGQRLHPPILDPGNMTEGYFLNDIADVDDAVAQCLAETGRYAGSLYCHPVYYDGSGDGQWSSWPAA